MYIFTYVLCVGIRVYAWVPAGMHGYLYISIMPNSKQLYLAEASLDRILMSSSFSCVFETNVDTIALSLN